MTLHVSLPVELENLVHHEVKSGMYGSASEVVREALRGFFGSTAGRQMQDMAALRNEMQQRRQKALAAEAPLIDGEQFFADMASKHGLNA